MDEVQKDPAGWKRYARELLYYTESVGDSAKAIETIKDLYDRYVKAGSFKPTCVYNSSTSREDIYSYHADGVDITYSGRNTYHRGDYDYFVNVSVCVDGDSLPEGYELTLLWVFLLGQEKLAFLLARSFQILP